jgi:hypothetical protein
MTTTNYDQSAVPEYSLPDPLTREDGTQVTRKEEWPARRKELLALIDKHQYGFAPTAEVKVEGIILEIHEDFLGGDAKMKQVEVVLSHEGKENRAGLLLFLPNNANAPVPAFLGLNFYGNHTVVPDPLIRLHKNWSPVRKDLGMLANCASESSRGCRAYRWPVKEVLSRGFALATVYCGDIDPDFDDGFQNGVHGLFEDRDFSCPPDERWGTLAAWGWGLSRILDYIRGEEEAIDGDRVIAIGHSRMGKAALIAGAHDERFAAVISNESGCSGATLHRRCFGERIQDINTKFPHWLNKRARQFNGAEETLPFDQHQLLALMAPRPLCIGSATEDLWADPKGEFLSLRSAEPVYRLLGVDSELPEEWPAAGKSVGTHIRYQLREGSHDILTDDWHHYLAFAEQVR